jgi:hypothetical protein
VDASNLAAWDVQLLLAALTLVNGMYALRDGPQSRQFGSKTIETGDLLSNAAYDDLACGVSVNDHTGTLYCMNQAAQQMIRVSPGKGNGGDLPQADIVILAYSGSVVASDRYPVAAAFGTGHPLAPRRISAA